MSWLKWTPNETHDITILSSDPVESFVHWGISGSQPCSGALCQLCATLGRPKHRWAVEVRKGEEGFTWDMSNSVYTNLCAISNKLRAFAGLQISITRNGSGLNTTYTLIPTGTVDVATLPPVTNTQATPGHFGANVEAEQLRVAQAMAETIKHLCAGAGIDPKSAYATWLTEDGEPFSTASADIQLECFCKYLEETLAPKRTDEAPALTAESLL